MVEAIKKDLMKTLYRHIIFFSIFLLLCLVALVFNIVGVVHDLQNGSYHMIFITIYGGLITFLLFQIIPALKDLFTVKKNGLIEYKGKIGLKKKSFLNDSLYPTIKTKKGKTIVLKYHNYREIELSEDKEYCFLYLKYTRFAELYFQEEQNQPITVNN